MKEEAKKRIAEFRFGVIHDLVGGRRLTRGQKERLLKEKTASEWDIPYSGRSYISRSTILNWVRLYEGGGRRLESLYPDDREDKGKIRAMDKEVIQEDRRRFEAELPNDIWQSDCMHGPMVNVDGKSIVFYDLHFFFFLREL